jgi:hypothetical protein
MVPLPLLRTVRYVATHTAQASQTPLAERGVLPMGTHLHDTGLGPTHVVVGGRTSSLKTASSALPHQAVYQSARRYNPICVTSYCSPKSKSLPTCKPNCTSCRWSSEAVSRRTRKVWGPS